MSWIVERIPQMGSQKIPIILVVIWIVTQINSIARCWGQGITVHPLLYLHFSHTPTLPFHSCLSLTLLLVTHVQSETYRTDFLQTFLRGGCLKKTEQKHSILVLIQITICIQEYYNSLYCCVQHKKYR